MSDAGAAISKDIIGAPGFAFVDGLHRQAKGAEEAALTISIAAIKAPDGLFQRGVRGGFQEASVAAHQHLTELCQIRHADPQATLRREDRAIVPGLIGGKIAVALGLGEDRAGRHHAFQVIAADVSILSIENDSARNFLGAAHCPVEARINRKWREDEAVDRLVEPLTGNALDDCGDDGEVDVRITEIAARRVRAVPDPAVGEVVLQTVPKGNQIEFATVRQARSMGHQKAQGDPSVWEGWIAQRPAEIVRNVGIQIEFLLLHQPHHAQRDGDLGNGGHPDRIVGGHDPPCRFIGQAAFQAGLDGIRPEGDDNTCPVGGICKWLGISGGGQRQGKGQQKQAAQHLERHEPSISGMHFGASRHERISFC